MIGDNLVVLHLWMSCVLQDDGDSPSLALVYKGTKRAHENLSVSFHGNHERGWLNLGSIIIDFSHQTSRN